MEEIGSAVVTGAVGLVAQLYQVLGQGLGVAVAIALLTWSGVEHLTPATWPAWKDRSLAFLAGVGMTVLGHLAVPALSYGPGRQGVAAAAFYGLLGGGGAILFHDTIAKRLFPPRLLNSGSAPPPETP
jgi:hypothetical protein